MKFGKIFPDQESVLAFFRVLDVVPRHNDPDLLPCDVPDCDGYFKIVAKTNKIYWERYDCSNSGTLYKHKVTMIYKHRKQRKGEELPYKLCNRTKSMLFKTFFEQNRIDWDKLLHLMFYWTNNMPVTDAVEQTGCSAITECDYYSLFREIAHLKVSNDAIANKIGGPGLHVEVDETFMSRRKKAGTNNHKARPAKGEKITIFSIICRETKLGIYVLVPNKSRVVLWSQMAYYIAPGSKIVSDCMPSYLHCDQWMPFTQHLRVTHSIEFVNEENSEANT